MNAGRQGATVAEATPGNLLGVDALVDRALTPFLKQHPEFISRIAMNWGVNDLGAGGLVEATWIGQYDQIIAYLHNTFPSAVFYATYPWRVGYDLQAATMHGWIDTVISHCASIGATCQPGPDEAVVIKGSDNGYTETDAFTGGSGVHYTNPLGVGLYANAMKAALGY